MCSAKAALSPHNIKTIKDICLSFNNNASSLINILHKVQETFGYLSIEVQEAIAQELSISVQRVYEVVSFYTFFTTKPKGKYTISICLGTACYVRGAEKILEELKKTLAINVGETTPDGLFSLDCLRCVGACGLAPVLMVGEKMYSRVEVNDIKKILNGYLT